MGYKLVDKLPLQGVKKTSEGYLIANVRAARVGIQDYLASELGLSGNQIIKVYRPESSVFDKDSISSYAFRPITNDHPPEMVDSKNWKNYSVGTTSGEVMRDGEYVRIPMMVMDESTISQIDDGKVELSMGYDCEIEMTSGVTDSGEVYDAIVKGLRMNHIAIVDRARGGEKLKIGDSKMGKLVIDGITVEVNDAAGEVIAKLQKQIGDANTAHDKVIATKDSEIAALTAKLKDAESKVLDSAAIDAMVAKRADIVANAKKLHDADYSGKSDAEIMCIALAAKLGDSAIAGKSAAYIEARFDAAIEDAKTPDAVRGVMQTKVSDNSAKAKDDDNGQSVYETRLRDSWKNK